MAEYIERQAVLKWFEPYLGVGETWIEIHPVLDAVHALPAADVAPVVHGRWIKTDNGVRENFNTGEAIRVYLHDCSVCGWHTGNQARDFNYCPNCGAHMKDGE